MQTYCNNCDKTGHTFQSCRLPIISNGIIAFRKNLDNEIEYLAVCRKHTFGYIDFLRGRYSVNNKNQLMDIIYEMTESEKNNILNFPFLKIWEELWGSSKNSYFINEKIFANEKFKILKNGVNVNNEFYNTKTLLLESKTNWETPEWGFPKGRKNYKENYTECAIREWCEETGYSSNMISIINNVDTFDEVVIGSNYLSYKDRYYLANFNGKCLDDIIKFQKLEISNAKWVTYKDLQKLIRPYHSERLELIKKVESLLNKYTQYI